MKQYIPFNKPYQSGNELQYISNALVANHLSGNGGYTKKCEQIIAEQLKVPKVLLTPSCTDALEMCALLLNIQPGDEVILPSFTFVSTATAFVLQGAKLVFVDSEVNNPNIDIDRIEEVITCRTKAIIIVHYAGVCIDMDRIVAITERHGICLIEDAAQALNAFYKDRPLGSIGQLATLSFHETKNIHCGEGGMLLINDPKFQTRAEIIRDKGTNRAAFSRGEVNKYQWVDIGSSFVLSEINAAFLYAQLQDMEQVTKKRIGIWNQYQDGLSVLEQSGYLTLAKNPSYVQSNGHIFYIIANTPDDRIRLIDFLAEKDINAVFHYVSLHSSPFYRERHDDRLLEMSEKYTDRLLRLPVWVGVEEHLPYIIDTVSSFYKK